MTTVADFSNSRQHSTVTPLDHARAVLNILEDYSAEKEQLRDTQVALLNILEDFTSERDYSRNVQSAVLNILDDSASEKDQLRNTQSAVLNILEDFGYEKQKLEGTEKAILNILEDAADEKANLEDMKKAVLNILEDLGLEKSRLEETQIEVRASLREKETLLKEIHHRVKNNLQVIASLLRLQARYLHDEQARAMFEESQNRVHSISLVHELLYQAQDLARVEFDNYLHTLTRHLSDSWKGKAESVAIAVEAPGVQLTVDKAIPCGLIVNELVTNALKHAFPGDRPGKIYVSARLGPPGWLTLNVQDDGIGLPEDLEIHRSGSLGLELVATLVRQLRAKLQVIREAGTTFELCLPISVD